MADNHMNDSTSFQQSDMTIIMCVTGCGFFGTATTMNMCSKCYRDQMASAKIAVEDSPLPQVNLVVPDEAVVSASSSATVSADEQAKPKMKNRCECCNKKVGMLGFQCKCGNTFCGSHRYPDEHQCTYDFVGVGKKAIAQANPLIKADKIARF